MTEAIENAFKKWNSLKMNLVRLAHLVFQLFRMQ